MCTFDRVHRPNSTGHVNRNLSFCARVTVCTNINRTYVAYVFFQPSCMHACMETLSFEPKKLWIKYTQALSRVLLKQTRVGRCTSLSILVSYIIARNKTEKSGESASSTLFTSWILADGWISPKIQVPEAHWDEQEPTCETNYKTLW